MISLILQFLFCSMVVFIAGLYVTKSTTHISSKIGLGDALGGMIILAIVTNLPEIAIMIAASIRGEVEIGISNILGGIAIQTVVICLFDFFRVDKSRSFTNETSSNQMIVEGLLVIFLLSCILMIYFAPTVPQYCGIPLPESFIVFIWILGVMVVSHDKKKALPSPESKLKLHHRLRNLKIDRNFVIFSVSALVILIGGYYLEEVGSKLAASLGISGIVFGATILAFVTALPDISTGLEAVWLKRGKLALSDIFGGNAFLPCLFILPAVYLGESIITKGKKEDMYLTALGIVLTVIYTAGLTIRSKRKFLNVGFDTIAVLFFYTLGILGLFLF